MKKFPHYRQLDAMDCGSTCLRMISKFYGKSYSADFLRQRASITREGVSLMGISDAAETIGFHSLGVQLPLDELKEVPLPCIAHWQQNHFVVIYKVTKKHVYISDPKSGHVKYTIEDFSNYWCSSESDGKKEGILLLIETTPEFYEDNINEVKDENKKSKKGIKFFMRYLYRYKSYLFQLLLGLILGSVLQLIFPFLTQSIVDVGIVNQNIEFVYLVLIAQVMLFLSQTAVQFIRSWIMLHISTRINISIISDFLMKLMKLPISFFDTKMTGDIMQRIGDHHRIEAFMTSSMLDTLFSTVNFIVFGAILAIYDIKIFLIFLLGSILYVIWVLLFLKKRKELDYKRFDEESANQSAIIHLISGMQEIKLTNSEKQKRWEWERIQARLFKISIKELALSQTQTAGSFFINEFKNIIISFFTAKAVIDGQMTLGMMLAVQYIIGQLNAPIHQFIGFIQAGQDAKISLERLAEIHDKEDEEKLEEKLDYVPENRTLVFDNVSFKYDKHSDLVLKNLSLEIPEGKVTAVVGSSGSGKTTLLKLLLKFYPPESGSLKVGGISLENVSNRLWRDKCGVVMQDGFIFSDSIAKNIAVGVDRIDIPRMAKAAETANVRDYIEDLPLAYNTKIGQDGIGMSGGQKQRLLITRSVYKNPDFLFFDEATSALDANNEKKIQENLDDFFKGKTVVVVAHRLSTVKNADQIIVLEKGELVEKGTHEELVALKGNYYQLVKNQLELGG